MSARCTAMAAVRQSSPSLLLLLLCCAALAAPAAAFNLQGGLPLDLLFATCETGANDDIGPCLSELLGGAIEVARPSFATGVKIGDDSVVLEPLTLDDIEPKKDSEFQLSATDLLVHNISTIQIEGINFSPETLALDLSFPTLSATGKLGLKYLFLTANPDVVIILDHLRVKVMTDWTIEQNLEEQQLDMVLSNAQVNVELHDFRVDIEGLAGLGRFIMRILNKNSGILVNFLIPSLEKSVTKKINRRLNRIKLAS